MKRFFSFIVRFLQEVKIEMKRVSWPTKKEVFSYTLLVLGVSVVTGIYLGGLDFLFQFILSKFVF
ncbi:MAG: preprotein translocase subunit SecE [Candidatus Spechtbacteria bacterium RIFCSPLOWO2_02_FULL_38_8]|uniref:Protein translocase subunit SecE n=1 Tax=Candidatus Spechtbacteria bacterium RIFCSPLOWO2_02_FULL_38_8 TaxID=1802164 RepID=A0A1G2HJP8_9BACT|nr:MAG: preprotein translocase subunit SecE [Candidatus Spechtbacteria bacterium RIFCSPLOWO2_02_FULL_38_8]